jgi:hypothetical protein
LDQAAVQKRLHRLIAGLPLQAEKWMETG